MTQNKSEFKILFVDDEEKNRKYFVKCLEKEFDTLTAESVSEAQKIIEEKHDEIAVVITDQRMPGGNGVNLLQYLRENFPSIIRLLTTAYSDLSDAIDSVNKGEILRYIKKPWDFDVLRNELRQAMDLFEIKIERDFLLHEKLMVKRKISKIDRVKHLVLLAKTINHIRFTSLAVGNFITEFATQKNIIEKGQEKDWHDFEMGGEDLLEILFLSEIVKTISKKISFDKNYNFENTINSTQIIAFIEEVTKAENIILADKISEITGELKISDYAFKTAITELLRHIGTTSKNLAVKISSENDGFVIDLKIPSNQSNEIDNNIFFASPIKKDQAESYANILIAYFFTWHHGGKIEIKKDDLSINYLVYFPSNPDNIAADSFSVEDLDNMLLLVNICDIA